MGFAPFWKAWGIQAGLGELGLFTCLYSELPPPGSVQAGTLLYTTDQGLVSSNGIDTWYSYFLSTTSGTLIAPHIVVNPPPTGPVGNNIGILVAGSNAQPLAIEIVNTDLTDPQSGSMYLWSDGTHITTAILQNPGYSGNVNMPNGTAWVLSNNLSYPLSFATLLKERMQIGGAGHIFMRVPDTAGAVLSIAASATCAGIAIDTSAGAFNGVELDAGGAFNTGLNMTPAGVAYLIAQGAGSILELGANSGVDLTIATDHGLFTAGATGGSKGSGTLNVHGGVYVDGVALVSSAGPANPSATIGLAAINGVAATFMRSDAAPALSQAIAPTWSALHTFGAGLTISAGSFTLNGHTLTLSANATVGGTNTGDQNLAPYALLSGAVFTGPISATNLSGTNTGDQTLPSGANPSANVGLVVVNGAAATFMRSDAAPLLSQAIVPTWTGLHRFTDPSGLVVQNDAGSTYGGTFKLTNSAAGATNPNKTFRINPTGGLEFINNAFNAVIMTLTDAGALSVSGAITGSNLSGTNTGDQTLPVGANPSASIGLAVVNGGAASFMRSDGAPALSQSITPTWTGLHTFTPSSGNAVIINGVTGQFAAIINGANSATGRGLNVVGAFTGAGPQALVTISDTNNTNGANLAFVGNGATTPTKTIRVVTPGILQIMDNAYTRVLMALTDAGNATFGAPSGGTALAVNAVSGQRALQVTGAGANFAMAIASGTNPAIYIDNTSNGTGTPAIRIDISATTGTATPTLGAVKPGANTAASQWLPISINGTTMYIPCWL